MRLVTVAHKCEPDDCTVICTPRYVEENEGNFVWSEQRKGWWHKDILRKQSPPKTFESRAMRAQYGVEDFTGWPLILEFCPFCNSPLSDLTIKTPEAPRNTQADGAPGGEGWE